MKSKVRYVIENQGEVTLFRRGLFWIWRRYEPFRNKLHKQEQKLEELYQKFLTEHAKYRDLKAEQKRAVDMVNNSRDCPKSYGSIFEKSMPLFPLSHKDIPQPPSNWRVFERAIKGGGSLADELAGFDGLNAVRIVNPSDISDGEIVGETPMAIRRQSGNQQKKQNNNQQNNNQQR